MISVKILNPILKLSNMEAKVLSFLMLLAFANRKKEATFLEGELLSYRSRVALRSKLDISEASLNNNISNLKKKGMLIKTDNGFALSDGVKSIVPENGKMEITFKLSTK